MKSKFQFLPRRITRSQVARTHRRFANKGKGALYVDLTVNDDSSDDDSSFKPIQEDSSSSEDNASMSKPRNKKLKDIKRGAYAAAKTKENIMQPDDALVEDVSDGEVDLGFVGTPGIVDVYEALDLEKNQRTGCLSGPVMKTMKNFEVHGHPTNMVVDLGKRLCTCQFWMLTGISCVHACATLARDIAESAAPAPSRPQKLSTKRRSSPPPQSIGVDPMQGASVATSFRLANFMKFVPTPGFKAPIKKTIHNFDIGMFRIVLRCFVKVS
ncbi:hypothetical protein Ahy_B08g091948 [Arachis hypogaea]|uniref:SWIM-type domain-containing protein n=1 Tax=Arachis hypogaea TaxID=3818 RepID=A0A444Y2X1_ARAHY|nr:hypothetical protein Ahy_B08g091948 [Arachis hypogaea]